jgi:hypothetical protein
MAPLIDRMFILHPIFPLLQLQFSCISWDSELILISLYIPGLFAWATSHFMLGAHTVGDGMDQSLQWLDYGLDDRGVGVRFSAGERNFTFLMTSRPAQGNIQPPMQ